MFRMALCPQKILMRLSKILAILLLICCTQCSTERPNRERTNKTPTVIEVHGHRGCRGLMPENTIAGFLHAIDLGVDAIEMDVVMNGDSQLVVSHEPYISPRICLDTNGQELLENMVEQLNMFEMTQAQIELYDCGLKPHENYPGQKKIAATKPLLVDVISAVNAHIAENGLKPIIWNIELKSKPKWYGTFQPEPGLYALALLKLLQETGLVEKTIIQCFDPKPLQALHKAAPELPLAFLSDNENDLETNLGILGFFPDYYSPHYSYLDEYLLERARAKGMRVLVWTVNDEEDMERMLELGPAGIITDFPDRVLKMLN